MCEHVRLLLNLLSRRVVKSFDQLHPALQKFVVRDPLPRPAFQDFVDSIAFFAAETVVQEVRVMNDLSDYANAWISDVNLLCQGFKGAVLPAMSESLFMEHVVRHGSTRHAILRRKSKEGFGVYKIADKPGRRAPIDARSWSRHPNPALVLFRFDLGGCAPGLGRVRPGRLLEQFLHALLQRAVKEIDLHDLLKPVAQPAEAARPFSFHARRGKRVQLADQFLVFPRSRFCEAADQLRLRQIVDGVHMNHRCFSSVLPDRRREPLKPLLIARVVRKQVAGIPERHRSVALQLPPNLDTLAGAFRRQRERQQQPCAFACASYVHFYPMLYL